MQGAKVRRLGVVDVEGRRVVPDEHHLDPLKAEHTERLRPAAVVADRHPEDAAERPPDREAEVADLEVALLEVLERDVRPVVGVAGQVDLPVLADDLPVRPDEDRGVEPACAPLAGRLDQFGVAEVEAHPEALRLLEEGPRLRPRHLPLEEAIRLREIVVPVAGEEGGEGQLRVCHQPAAARRRLAHERDEPGHHLPAGFREMDRPELGRRHLELSRHRVLPPVCPSALPRTCCPEPVSKSDFTASA